MRRTLLSTILLLAVSLSASAQPARQAAPPVQAPVYAMPAGAKVVTEINLSEADILGMVKRAIPAFAERAKASGGETAQFVSMLNLDELYDAIEGVKAVRVVQFTLDGRAEPAAVLAHFHAQVPESLGWTRIYYSTKVCPEGLFAVYSMGGRGFLCVMVNPKTGTHTVASVEGALDLEKLAGWVGNVVGMIPKSHRPAPQPAAQ